jgi:hypothetical protein
MTNAREQRDTPEGDHALGPALVYGVSLAVASLVSFELIKQLLGHVYFVSRDDELLGGMWSAVATVFVYRETFRGSIHAALSRMAATLLSFALCFLYLLALPFHAWGLAALIGAGTIILMLAGRPEDIVTTAITTTVVLVVASISPVRAWIQPILRLLDTAAGVTVGIVAARLALMVALPSHRRSANCAETGKPSPASVHEPTQCRRTDGVI